jgi:spore coat protein H
MSPIQLLRAGQGKRFWKNTVVAALLCVCLGMLRLTAADLFEKRLTPDLRIEISEEGTEVLRAYQWQGGRTDEQRTDVPATVYEGDRMYTNVAVHLKGAAGSFRPFDDRPALTLHFGKNGNRQRFHDIEKLHLNNSVQDPSYLSEILAREVCNAANIPTPRATHCLVTLNGRPLGVYVLVEGWTKAFLKRHFGNTKGNLYDSGFARDIDQELTVNSGEHPQDQSDLASLVRTARIADPNQRMAELEKRIELDRFYSLVAMEVLLSHWDGYSIGRNNYRIYENQSSGRLAFLPHGMDQLFGVYRSTPEFTIHPKFKGLVADSVISTKAGRAAYLQRLGQLYTNYFTEGKLTRRLDDLATRTAPLFQSNTRRSLVWSNAVAGLRNRIERRVVSVGDQLANPRQPLAFGKTGSAILKAWGFKTDSSGEARGERSLQDGHYQLKIHGGQNQARTWASWRHSELLDEGIYELRARVRLDAGVTPNGMPTPEIALRLSGQRGGFPRASGAEWQELVHTFEVSGPTEIEMLCELRGVNGTALIDANSLRLIKRPGKQSN